MTTLQYFHPRQANFEQTLTPTEAFYAGMLPKGSLVYEGSIDKQKFIDALNHTLQVFHPLFCLLKQNGDTITAQYRQDENHFITLEIERYPESRATFGLSYSIPNKLDERMLMGITDDIHDLPMAAFSLTLLNDGFVIGYVINHVYFDQSSLVYFFKYLSMCYEGRGELSDPIFIDIEALLPEQFKQSFDLETLRAEAETLGFIHAQTAKRRGLSNQPMEKRPRLMIIRDAYFQAIKADSQQTISKNDITHALLLKCYAGLNTLTEDTTLHLGYACNMRSRLGLGENTIGNVLHFTHLPPVTPAFAKEANLATLAAFNRQAVSTLNTDDYFRRLNWFRQLYHLNEKPTDYQMLSCFDPHYFGHTNWTSFDYTAIVFNGHAPLQLWTPPFPSDIQFTVSLSQKMKDEDVTIIPIHLDDETYQHFSDNHRELFELS